ncbi:uncharacterized protein LOC119449025 [Dermacentor silvarum]|uniref:uncharacterized protein LOC119449025 n=1 Tax=Dermacentor silvarum TaxID=543639 RepID=UPI00189BE224|nr:uncharacterized protein LOC119449025 [Dermacentor silvarum]
MERVALARLRVDCGPTRVLPGAPEQQTGFRRQRCTADSISDVVATLEDAKAIGDVAMLVLLDIKSALDGHPHAVIEACLDRLGLSGCLRGFISAFLTGRTFRVRVEQELSEPRDTMTGVPQGSRPGESSWRFCTEMPLGASWGSQSIHRSLQHWQRLLNGRCR